MTIKIVQAVSTLAFLIVCLLAYFGFMGAVLYAGTRIVKLAWGQP